MEIMILAAGIATYAIYQFAFGYGRSQYEKLWAIKAYAVVSLLLAGEVRMKSFLSDMKYKS